MVSALVLREVDDRLPKVLLVEDDKNLGIEVKDWLEDIDGLTVEHVCNGEDALQILSAFGFDLIILDWELPGISGLQVCRDFRSAGGQTPILFLTGRTAIDDKEAGFGHGADDYLAKPYNVRELSLRCKALLRRSREQTVFENSDKKILLKPDDNLLVVNESNVSLTKLECALLRHLMTHPGKHFSSADLLKSVWPSQKESSEEAVRVLIRGLRRKLSALNEELSKNLIESVPGGGYVYHP